MWMVMVALWALFSQIRQNSSFSFTFLVFLLDWWPSGRGLLAEQNGGRGCHRVLSQKVCCHWSWSHIVGWIWAHFIPCISVLGGCYRDRASAKEWPKLGKCEAGLWLQVHSWVIGIDLPSFALYQDPAGENSVLWLIAVTWFQYFPIRYFN